MICFVLTGLYQMMVYMVLFCFFILSLQLRDNLSDCTLFMIHNSVIFWTRPYFFCTDLSGDLGGQMFKYAFMTSMKVRYSSDIIVANENLLTSAFDINSENEIILKYCACFEEEKESKKLLGFDKVLLQVDRRFTGDFFDYRYFEKHKNEIRARFRMRRWLKSLVNKDLTSLLSGSRRTRQNTTLVGIYIGTFNLPEMKTQQIESFLYKARDKFRARYSNALFVAVVDVDHNISWLKKKFLRAADIAEIVYLREEYSIGMLNMMDHSIVIGGSIGWWGAYLNTGSVIYLDPPSSMVTNFTLKYPPQWEGLPVE